MCCWPTTPAPTSTRSACTSCARASCTACACDCAPRSGSAANPEILDERVAAPVVVVGMMRSGTTLLQRLLAADPRFHCAYGWEVVEVAPRAGLPVHRCRSAHRRQRSARSQIPRTGARPVRHPPDVCARSRGRDRLSGRRVLVACPRIRRAPSELPILARRAGFHPRLRVPAPHAAVPAVAEAAARGRWQTAGCSSRRRTSATSTCCGPSSATCTSCTCTATRAPRSPRGPASTRPCTRCTPTPSTCIGWARNGCSGWAGPMTAQWRSATAGPTRVLNASPTSRFDDAVADPIGQVARVYDAIGLPLDRRGGRRDATLAATIVPARRRARPTVWKTTACVPSRSTSDSRCTTSGFEQYVGK